MLAWRPPGWWQDIIDRRALVQSSWPPSSKEAPVQVRSVWRASYLAVRRHEPQRVCIINYAPATSIATAAAAGRGDSRAGRHSIN